MIDTKFQVAAKAAGTIIPPRVMTIFLSVQTKGIRKSPVFDMLQGCTLRLAEEYAVLPQARVVHVALFRRHIEIAAEQYRRFTVIVLIEELAQPAHPLKFELILFRADNLAIGD